MSEDSEEDEVRASRHPHRRRKSQPLLGHSSPQGTTPGSYVRYFTHEPELLDFIKGLKDVNAPDCYGNTALHYAVFLHRQDIVDLLLSLGAKTSVRDRANWDPLQLAMAGKNTALLKTLVLAQAQYLHDLIEEQLSSFYSAVERLPDFEAVVAWQVQSWLPGLTGLCPSDRHRLVKRGSSIRLDFSLFGVEGLIPSWVRGNLSVVFCGRHSAEPGAVYLLDHDNKFKDRSLKRMDDDFVVEDIDTDTQVRPELDLSNIHLQPQYGWFGQQKTCQVGEWEGKMFDLKDFVVGVKRRAYKNDDLLDLHFFDLDKWNLEQCLQSNPHLGLFYPGEVFKRGKKAFSASLCLSREFPHTPQEFLPLFRAVLPRNRHYEKFATLLSLPVFEEGFPVKIGSLHFADEFLEIPMVPSVKAVITFESFIEKEVDESEFVIPADYTDKKLEPKIDKKYRSNQ